jgi:lactoylglutathione lyase
MLEKLLVLFRQVDYVMVIVSDMIRSIRFYRDTLGLSLKFESPDWSELQTGTTTLALHGGGKPGSGGFHEPGEGMTAGTCSIGFNADDLDSLYEELKSKGVHFIMPPTLRKDEGIRLSVCLDPDGLPISIAERLRK